MDTTFDVRIYKTDVYKGNRTTTYKVRWQVAGKRFKKPFKTSALAESFRSELLAAARKGHSVSAYGRAASLNGASDEGHGLV